MAYGVNAPFGLRSLSSINGGAWTEKTNVYYIAGGVYKDIDPLAVSASLNVSIFQGDPVRWATGTITNPTGPVAGTLDFNAATSASPGTIVPYITPGVNVAAATALPVLGVFHSCEYFNNTNQRIVSEYWPAATSVYPGSIIKAYIMDDPDILWDIQISTSTDDNNAANTANLQVIINDFGQNANFNIAPGGSGGGVWTNSIPNPNLIGIQPVNPGTGSLLGQSGYYLDGNSIDYTPNPTFSFKILGLTQNPTNITQFGANTLINGANYTGVFCNVWGKINNHVFGSGGVGGPNARVAS